MHYYIKPREIKRRPPPSQEDSLCIYTAFLCKTYTYYYY